MMVNEKRELIDRKQIVYTWWKLPNGKFSDGVVLQSVIQSMPTVDAVEVVRCKDCKWFDPNEDVMSQSGACEYHEMVKMFWDFCSRGKKDEERSYGKR